MIGEVESVTPAVLRAEELAGQLVCVPLRDYRGDVAAREEFLRGVERYMQRLAIQGSRPTVEAITGTKP